MYTIENKAIGTRVRKKREEFKLSREKVAEKIGISSRFLSDIELGNKGMSQQTLLTLCDTLHTTPNYILLGIEQDQTDSKLVRLAKSITPKYQPYIENILLSVLNEMRDFENNTKTQSPENTLDTV